MRHLQVLALLALAAFTGSAHAQTYAREGTWEFGMLLLDTGNETVSGQAGTSLALKGDLGWGLWGAYNFNNRLAVAFDWTHTSPDYTLTYREDIGGQIPGPQQTIRHEADLDNIHIKGTFYFLEGDFTPFVEAGLGWTWVDSNIATGPPTTGCWWDPWWGYVCSSFYDTYDSTQTSYTYSAGVRWDISPEFTVRADYGILDIDLSAASGSAEMDGFRLGFGWRF